MICLAYFPIQTNRGFCKPNDQFQQNLAAVDAELGIVPGEPAQEPQLPPAPQSPRKPKDKQS
jgi:hypothetical protein